MRLLRFANPLPSRYRRPLRRLVKLAAFVALILLLVQALVLPRFVASVLHSTLADLGYPQAQFRVSGATFFHTQLSNLDLGESGRGARAAAIGVDYSPWSLLHGRVKTVRIAGAELAVAIRGNKVDLGVLGLGKTRTDPPARQSTAQSKTPRPAAAISLPLDRLELRGCTLAVDWDGRQLWIPVEGGAASPGAGAVQLALDVRVQGALTRINASFATADRFDITATANGLSVASLAAALPASYTAQYPLVGGGTINATARYTQAGELRKTSANASLDGVRLFTLIGGHRLLIGELTGKGAVELDSSFGLADASFDGKLRRVAFDAIAGRDITLKLAREEKMLRVDLSAGDVDLAPAGIVLGGVAAQLKFDADASAAGTTMRLAESSRISLDAFAQSGAGYALMKSNRAAPQVTLSVVEAVTLHLPPSESGWRVSAPELQLEIPSSRLKLDGGTELENASALLRLRMEGSSDGFVLRARDGSRIAFDSLHQAVAGDVLRTGPWGMNIASEEGRPLLEISDTPRGMAARLNMTAQGDSALSGKSRDIEFAAGRVGLLLDAIFAQGPPSVRAWLDLREASGSYKPADLAIAKINARIPFAWNRDVQERGGVHIEGARVAGSEIAPIDGALSMSGTLLKLSAVSSILDAGKLEVSGQFDLAGGNVRGVLDAQVPPFELADAKALSRTAPALEGYDVTGTLAARARLELTSVGMQPRFEVSIKDGRLHNPTSGWLVEGIQVGGAGADPLVIDSITPLSTPGGQTIQVARVVMGKVELTRGLLSFEIENPESVFIEGVEFGWAGGRLYSNAFRLDRTRGRLDAVISADRLRLEELLPVFTDRVTGQGAVYGRLPIAIRWPQRIENKTRMVDWNRPMLSFGDGFVYATPGGGRLQIKDPEQLVGKQLDAWLAANPQLAKAGVLEQVKRRILKAMSDLDYDVLKLDLVRRGNGANAQTGGQAFLSGKEHGDVADPVPLGGITLLVDFDRLVRSVMGLQQRLGQ